MSTTHSLRKLIRIHYGKALKAEQRDGNGQWAVYGSSGQVGLHTETLTRDATIIIGRKGSVGEITYAPNGGWTIDTAFYVEILDKSKLDLRYLYYSLRKLNLQKHTITTSIPGISRELIYDSCIPVPSLPEQKRIAAILDKADAIRRKREKAIELTDSFLRSVFLEMFGDPVLNSRGWEVRKLGDMGELNRGKSKHRPRNAPELLGGKYPLIQTGDVANSSGYIRTFDSTYSDFGLAQSRLWDEGTLCITIAANIAKTGILTFKACFPDSVVGFHPNDFTTTEYIQSWFSFLQKILEDSAPESAQKNINLEILRRLDVICPPIELQNMFSQIVRRIEALREKHRSFASQAEVLCSSVSQKLLSARAAPHVKEGNSNFSTEVAHAL